MALVINDACVGCRVELSQSDLSETGNMRMGTRIPQVTEAPHLGGADPTAGHTVGASHTHAVTLHRRRTGGRHLDQVGRTVEVRWLTGGGSQAEADVTQPSDRSCSRCDGGKADGENWHQVE